MFLRNLTQWRIVLTCIFYIVIVALMLHRNIQTNLVPLGFAKVFRSLNLSMVTTSQDRKNVTILAFATDNQPQFADLNFRGSLKETCQLDFNCDFVSATDFQNISGFTAVLIAGQEENVASILNNDEKTGKFKRNRNQIWITTTSEAALNNIHFNFNGTNLNDVFNWSMSYSTLSTIYRPWFYVNRIATTQSFSAVKEEIKGMNKTKVFCWIVSNCWGDWANRAKVANDLIPLLPSKLHVWGSSYNSCLSSDSQQNSVDHGAFPGHYWELYEPQQEKMRDCKFYLAFDNAICSDFVTEKFSNALEVGAIPIVNGWKDSYEQRVPGSFIHVSDFSSMQELANYLQKLLQDQSALMEYHKWRLKYQIERLKLQPQCALCRKLKDFQRSPKQAIIPDRHEMVFSLTNCTIV